MSRRTKGEGNIRLRSDGRWEARYTLPGGKSRSLMAKTRQDVREKLTEALRNLDRGITAPQDNRQTVGEYLATWLETKKTTVEYSHWKRCETVIRLYVLPMIGRTPLTKLTAQQIQQIYAHVLGLGRAPNTVAKIHIALHKALEDALRLDLVSRNVADLVDKPKDRHREMAIYTPEQIRRLIEAARGDRLEPIYILFPTTGCRLGELLGLRWEALDLERGEMRVTAAMKDVGGKRWMGEPKTERSRRTIPLTELAVLSLRQHHINQTSERLKHGGNWNPQHLVFCTKNGTAISQTNFRKQYYIPMLEKAGLPYIRPHDQRHTNASVQLNAGEQVHLVSAWLGHANPSTTLNIYGHIVPGMKEQARDKLAQLLETQGNSGSEK